MSQPAPTATAAAAPSVAAPAAPAVSVAPEAPPASAPRPRDTPHQLRLLGAGLVALGVVVALVGVVTFALLAYGLGRAEADTDQLVRVQSIQTDLLTADATATNAFLVGGLEPEAQRATYDDAMNRTSGLIAEAVRAQPADVAALAALNQEVLSYDAAIEQARANNRQGFPVGAQYLRGASSQLRGTALPVLEELVSANAGRAAERMGVGWGYLFCVVGLLGLVGLVLAQLWLARRFHRRVNTGLLAASVVLSIALLAGLVAMVGLSRQVATTRAGDFADVNAAASARIWANNAKANESLTLIARGSGSAFEAAWTDSAAVVDRQLSQLGSPSLTGDWAGYTAVHRSIRALDDEGQWDRAVAQATGTGEDGSNARFAVVDAGLADVLTTAGGSTRNALAGQQPGLVVTALLSLLAGVAVALLGRRGIDARLREYR